MLVLSELITPGVSLILCPLSGQGWEKHVCILTYACIYVYVYLCIYLYKYIY